MLHIKTSFTLPDMDRLVDKYNIKADKVADVAKKAIDATTDWALGEMRARVFPHIDKGDAFSTLEKEDAKVYANIVSGRVGALNIRDEGGKESKGFHIVYQEHGGKAGNGADPWYRPVMSKKAKMKEIQEMIFKREGYV